VFARSLRGHSAVGVRRFGALLWAARRAVRAALGGLARSESAPSLLLRRAAGLGRPFALLWAALCAVRAALGGFAL